MTKIIGPLFVVKQVISDMKYEGKWGQLYIFHSHYSFISAKSHVKQ